MGIAHMTNDMPNFFQGGIERTYMTVFVPFGMRFVSP